MNIKNTILCMRYLVELIENWENKVKYRVEIDDMLLSFELNNSLSKEHKLKLWVGRRTVFSSNSFSVTTDRPLLRVIDNRK